MSHAKYNVDIKDSSGNIVAYATCSSIGELVTINTLFVGEKHKHKNFDDFLLEKVEEYAKSKNARRIFAPFEKGSGFFEMHGYHKRNHTLNGYPLCLEKVI